MNKQNIHKVSENKLNNKSHKFTNKQQYGLYSFMKKNNLAYYCVNCQILINHNTYYNHANHRISIKESSEYILLKLTDYYNNLKKLTKELNTIFDIIKECCLHIIDSRNNTTYIVLSETFNKNISYQVDNIPVPFDKDQYITYKNKYDPTITIQLIEDRQVDKERYKKDLKYIYLYTLNRLRLYSYIDSKGILQFNDDIVWKYVSQVKNSYLIQLGLTQDKWYDFIAIRAIEYLRNQWNDETLNNKDDFYKLYNTLCSMTKHIIQDTDNKFNKEIKRNNKFNTSTHNVDLNKIGLKSYITNKVDKNFKAYFSTLVKLYLYGNNANISLRTISLISGLTFVSVQKYTKILIGNNIIHDRKDNYKFTDKVLKNISNVQQIEQVETSPVQNIETYDETLAIYKKDWRLYYTQVTNIIRTYNSNLNLRDILNGVINNNPNIINRRQIILNDQEYIHKEYTYNLIFMCKSVLASIDSGICNLFVKSYYGKVKSILLAINKRLSKNKDIVEGINYGMLLRGNINGNNDGLDIGYIEQEYLMHIVRSIIINELKVVKRWNYMRKKIPNNVLEELDEKRGKFVSILQGKEYRLEI